MHDLRSQFSKNIQKKIKNVSCHFSGQDFYHIQFDDDVISSLADKISKAIPDVYFYFQSSNNANLLYKIIADEFVLFQCQEDIKSDEYAQRFLLFTYELINLLDNLYSLELPDDWT